jgi:L-lactate dehydrogenase complex protein LldG
VAGIVAGHGARTFVAWDELPVPGVAPALGAAGLERLESVVPAQRRTEHMVSFRDLEVGVTGATCGLAESGSIVLSHGEGRPRLASLVPEIHIALLDTSTIVRTLAHWARENPDSVAATTNLVVVTGPSRTGDIEQTLNLGVHGPRHVHIVMMR